MAVTVRKYNPGFLSDDELVASFRVRTHEFDSTVEMLRECTGSANAHRLVIGPHGSGKTSLLLRVVAELRRAPDLSSRFFPVVFAEESYMVATAGEFWLEALSRLAEQATGPAERAALRRSRDDLRMVGDDRALGERCLGAVLDFADREGKRLVLVVENLNAMFADMADAEEAGWRLRKTLQTEPRIVVLGSATSRFDQIDNPDRALYDLFRVVPLRPLDDDECETLWESVSGRGRAPGTVRALRILTGGSPRLLAVLARFGGGLSFRDLMGGLLELIDDHTEYFRSHLAALPAQERRVYLALADLWKPATAREVADRARLGTSKCSAQLARLVDRGAIDVAGGEPRRRRYYLAERLYNIYYLLRRASGADPLVEALVRFMASYYAPGELSAAAAGMAHEGATANEAMRSLLRSAFARLAALPALQAHEEELRSPAPPDFWLAALDAIVDREEVEVHALGDVEDALERASRLVDDDRLEEALAVCDGAVRTLEHHESPVVVQAVAHVLVRRADVLVQLDRPLEALAAYEDGLGRFGRDGSPAVLRSVASALLGKGVALEALDRFEEALAAYDEAAGRFGDSVSPTVVAQVAAALLRRAAVLTRIQALDRALAAYDEFALRFADAEARFDGLIAAALNGKGSVLESLNRNEEATAAYNEAARRFADADDAAVGMAVCRALLGKGRALATLDRQDESLAAYDELLRRLAPLDAPDVSELTAGALLGKALTLTSMDRPAALATLDELLRLLGAGNIRGYSLIVAAALVLKAGLLACMDRLAEALAVGNSVVHRFGASEDSGLRLAVAWALDGKGTVFSAMNRPAEALDAWDEVLRRVETKEAPAAPELIAGSLLGKGSALLQLDRTSAAFNAWDDVVRRFAASDAPALRRQADEALLKRAHAEMRQRRYDEAIATADLVLDAPGRATPEDRWRAHLIRAIAVRRKGNPSACEADIAAMFGVLPGMDVLPSELGQTLRWASWTVGQERLRKLIAASPSADLLLPFTVALERELGVESRVAREIEEVAEDIRRDLAKQGCEPFPPR